MTGCATSLQIAEDIGDFPIVQVWHPINFTFYTRVGTAYGLTEDDINRTTDHYDNVYYLGNVSCTGNDINEFQSGDVIGYYQSDRPRYLLWNAAFSGYTYYHHDVNSTLDTFNINNANVIDSRQLLIQVIHGKNINGMLFVVCKNRAAPPDFRNAP